MIKIENNQVYSTAEGMKVRRRGTEDSGWSRMSALPGETVADFEEVEPGAEPPYTEAERTARIVALIRRRYSADDEFALQRKMLAAMLHPEAMALDEDGGTETSGSPTAPGIVKEFEAYDAYVEQCKREATAALLAEATVQQQTE